jgi:hypothetical protein
LGFLVSARGIFTIGFELVVKPPTRHTSSKWPKYPWLHTPFRRLITGSKSRETNNGKQITGNK